MDIQPTHSLAENKLSCCICLSLTRPPRAPNFMAGRFAALTQAFLKKALYTLLSRAALD